ncbi:LysR family transcriptional regulator, transcription activator of glutamate synthase operon [Bacillus sp. OV322]|uniref:LysR family transcriptional regulator n=1 Tax=Bacillus sp. OV322 TaxID=1882764 RepID=UPI0008E613CF|nr:LysR family transcriptional regulator [Bacillus sp. OV322]SFC25105.1 LysR family transcriptional regulator, transcription activator of glutamate synthase operon [Bacillus sp. OV322]
MELRQLRYFIEVAEREHVSEAAVHLHVAQSAISLQISKLETELGVQLFERAGRNIKLTHIGKIFLHHIKTAIKAIDYAKGQVDEYLNPEHGTIKIGYPTSLASYLLPTIISAYKNKQPSVSFHLHQGSYSSLIESVKNGDINLALLGPVPPEDEEINTRILFTENLSALVPINHPLAEKKSLALSELRNDDFVLFPAGYVLRRIAVEACRQAGFKPKTASEGADMDAIKGLVSAGMGVSILPDGTFYDSTPRFTAKIPIEAPRVRRTVGIITPKTRELAPSEKDFYQFIKEFFTVLEHYQ